MHEALDEIYKMPLHKFRPEAIIGAASPFDRGKGVPSFDEMVAIVLEEVDFDDPTTNM